MRRKDREVTDQAVIQEIIRACDCCRLGLNDNGSVYIVPLSFGHEAADGKDVFYFHSAQEGRKIDLIRATGRAGFELDTGYQVVAAREACGHTARFQSVIGVGRVSLVEDPEEKVHAMRTIMAHATGRSDWTITEAMLRRTGIIRLDVEELSCKVHE